MLPALNLDIGALAWNTSTSSLCVNYFDIIDEQIDEEKQEAKEAKKASEVARDASKRRRGDDSAAAEQVAAAASQTTLDDSQAGDYNTPLAPEHAAHLQWLRLCLVPSKPSGPGVRSVVEIPSNEEPNYHQAIININNRIGQSARLAIIDKIEDGRIRSRITDVNNVPGHGLRPTQNGSLNSGDRGKYEQLYIDELRNTQANDGFSDEELPDSDLTQVAHIVPKVWLRTTRVLSEFDKAANDPNNIILTRAEFNRDMGVKGILILNRSLSDRYSVGSYWAPQGFTMKNRAAVARAVAAVALTYPFVSASEPEITGGRTQTNGMPLYFRQLETIQQLLAEQPSQEELDKEMLSFALFGWVNPLTLSNAVRTQVRNATHPLGLLLKRRLAGTDLGSAAVAHKLIQLGVDFSIPWLRGMPNTRESKESKQG